MLEPFTNDYHAPEAMSFLLKLKFWQRALKMALAFGRYCLLPAIILTSASIFLVLSMFYVEQILAAPSVTPDDLVRAAAVGFISLILALPVAFWATWIWMLRLTAFCRALLLNAGTKLPDFAGAVYQVKQAQPYLAKVWFVASFYIFLPALVLSFCASVQLLAESADFRKLTEIVLSPSLVFFCNVLAVFLSVICLVYTAIVMVKASSLEEKPLTVAHTSMLVFLQRPVALLVLGLAVLALNLLFQAPQFFSPGKGLVGGGALVIEILTQIWFGASSLVLFSFSLYPFACYLKGHPPENDQSAG